MVVGIFPRFPPRFESCVLFVDTYVCLMREGHPLAGVELTPGTISGARHLSLRAVPAATALIDEFLAAQSLSRTVMMTVNQVAAIPPIIEQTDLVACILRSTARSIGRAACRERVCRYVSIPVDDIALKKKNDTHTKA